MNRVKHFLILVLTLTMSLGAWAQTAPAVQVMQDNNLDWIFQMPDYDVVVNVEYYNGYMLTFASNGNGVVGFSGDTLPQGVTPGTTANTYLVQPGTQVTLKATADEGYIFTDWNDQNTDNPRSITVTSDTTFTANFAAETYTVTLNDGGVDPSHWTGKVGDDATVGFSAFPLENVTATQTVTVKYDGTRKVKSITLVPVDPEPAGPSLSTPLTLKAITAGTVVVNNPPQGMQYSLNGGAKTPVTSTAIEVSVGDSVAFYGDGTNITSYQGTMITGGTAQVKMYGNIMSLVDETGFATATVLSNDYAFKQLFKGYNSLTDASGLKLPATILTSGCFSYMFYNCQNMASAPTLLPATTLANSCYNGMFYGCSSLTSTPELPATTLTPQCYYCMFGNCTSLTATPALPATTVDESSCYQMFYHCTSLTTVPDTLPATTLASQCYSGMFNMCSSLTTAPALPATTLAEGCYTSMFYMCSSLTTAPDLPAPTLTSQCYHRMFSYCGQLNSVTCLATTFADNSTLEWLEYVATSGTFTKAANANWEEGASGIPSGWNIVTSGN